MSGFNSKRDAAADKLQEPVCDKDPHGCWNVRCQLGKQCKNLAQPAQEPVDWEQIYWDMVNAMLRDKLRAQPAQKPVLWAAKESMFMWGDSDEHGHPYHVITKSKKVQSHQIPLYTTPPQRKPLTDADYVNACISYRHDFGLMTQEQRDKLIFQAREWARAFGMNEAAQGIKEKNT